jgi:hypothetical protein
MYDTQCIRMHIQRRQPIIIYIDPDTRLFSWGARVHEFMNDSTHHESHAYTLPLHRPSHLGPACSFLRHRPPQRAVLDELKRRIGGPFHVLAIKDYATERARARARERKKLSERQHRYLCGGAQEKSMLDESA